MTSANGAPSKIFALYNQETEDNSTPIIQMEVTYNNTTPLVFSSGGAAGAGAAGGPAFLSVCEFGLDGSGVTYGFRTVSRIDGSSKNLQIRATS